MKIERKKSEAKRSELVGVVMDPNGAVIPGIRVNLSLKGEDKGVVSTDEKGEFQIIDVAPAKKYRLEIGAKNSLGFKSATTSDLVVGEGERLVFTVTLGVRGDVVVVGLYAEESVIDIGSSTIEKKITRRKLESIPHE